MTALQSPVTASRPHAWRLVASLAASQTAWFACVLGAAHGYATAGVTAAIAAFVVCCALGDDPAADARLALVAVGVGLVWDTALIRWHVVEYASPGLLPQWAPVWILALWALFATMLRVPLRWLHGRPVLGAALGGIGGALSYAGAARLGACRFPEATAAMVVLGAGWAVVTPLLIEAARRIRPSRDAVVVAS